MNNSRGIFDSFPGQAPATSPFAAAPETPPASPFAVAREAVPASPFAVAAEPIASPFATAPDPANPFAAVTEIAPPVNPFAAAARADSPFATADDAVAARPLEPGKPARLPEKRKADSPFQASDAKEGFGFEAPVPAPIASFTASPFEVAPATSPFAVAAPAPAPAPAAPAASPFSYEPTPPPVQPPAAPSYGGWPQAAPAQPAAPAPQQQSYNSLGESDSSHIRQLELRAIFGVDQEMSPDEILQRARALPGIRHIARVSAQDTATIDSLKQVIANLGFGGGGLKLFAGSVPVEFIREGNVLLAVQTDGGFAPGVRETLMIVGRELGRA